MHVYFVLATGGSPGWLKFGSPTYLSPAVAAVSAVAAPLACAGQGAAAGGGGQEMAVVELGEGLEVGLVERHHSQDQVHLQKAVVKHV